jgi:SH3-like domain-containing protein
MKMKPFYVLALCLALCSFWACGGKQQAAGTQDSTATTVAPTESKEKWMVLKYDDMRLRDAPSKAGAVLATYKEGAQVLDLGERSDNEEVVELRGEQIKAKWMKVRGADGKEGWIFGGALAPAPDASVTAFAQSLDKLTLEDCKSIHDALNQYAAAMKGKSPEIADQAVVPLFEYLDRLVLNLNASVQIRSDLDDAYTTYNPSEGQKIEPKYKAEKDAWEACGLELRFPEGMLDIELKPGVTIPTLEPIVSKAMRRYLEIRKKEEANIWMNDGGLSITPQEIADRAVTWDIFLIDNPDFIFKTEIRASKIGYLGVLLVGADNTPAFDYDSGKLFGTEFKDAWQWVLKTHPQTETGKIVQEWWDVLKSENWKRGPKSEKYIQAFWKANE